MLKLIGYKEDGTEVEIKKDNCGCLPSIHGALPHEWHMIKFDEKKHKEIKKQVEELADGKNPQAFALFEYWVKLGKNLCDEKLSFANKHKIVRWKEVEV